MKIKIFLLILRFSKKRAKKASKKIENHIVEQ